MTCADRCPQFKTITLPSLLGSGHHYSPIQRWQWALYHSHESKIHIVNVTESSL